MIFFRKSRNENPIISQDLEDLRNATEQAQLSDYAASVINKELERLEKTDPGTVDYTIGLNYIEYLISLPWNSYTDDNLDLARAQTILESSHTGLSHVKDRILDYLAVRTLCSLQKFRVLVVDDESIARDNLAYVLSKEGYDVDTAGNGEEALGKCREHDFDLVLTDLKMEKMDGLQLLESLKDTSPLTDIVMITGYATVSTAVDALRKGAIHYMAKPIDLEELRSIAKQIRQKKRHLQMARGPILCFAGPPGTGKTSIGQAIAKALKRKFVRLSLAGLRDEAELRGHRRTYAGALPGRIIQLIRDIGVKNPVFMLDEIDKIGQDFRGDPASVLLEILDPEQNTYFVDHYLDVPFDLSTVMFIATANIVERLPRPLIDRLEHIDFPGYTEQEKIKIAQKHIIPRLYDDHGLTRNPPRFEKDALVQIIQGYTREAGLRQLERQIAKVCRKVARLCVSQQLVQGIETIDVKRVQEFLGPRRFKPAVAARGDQVGITTGLVCSEFGGEIIFVEAKRMRGARQLILTGSLGKVLQESAQTALSYIRGHAEDYGIDPDFFKASDIHIHIPAGGTPKDGPSAGITIALALLSLLTGRPARRYVALSGELSLSGRILHVEGVREKILAAQRVGMKCVIFPKDNEVDVVNLDSDVIAGLELVLVESFDEAVEKTLL